MNGTISQSFDKGSKLHTHTGWVSRISTSRHNKYPNKNIRRTVGVSLTHYSLKLVITSKSFKTTKDKNDPEKHQTVKFKIFMGYVLTSKSTDYSILRVLQIPSCLQEKGTIICP